jgi:hypothetical protein
MSSKVIIPLNDFADVISRLQSVEARLAEVEAWRKTDGVYTYGPCKRCGYGPWDSYQARPSRNCPRCHSAYWNVEPRNARSRKPGDPPAPSWGAMQRPRKRMTTAPATTTPAAPSTAPPAEPTVALPPELRPDVIVPRPPTFADVGVNLAPPITSVNREPTIIHVAPLPDAIVSAIVAGAEKVSYDDIKAAKSDDSATNSAVVEGAPQGTVQGPTTRPKPPALAAKKAEFFAGFTVPEVLPEEEAAPFVAPSDVKPTVPDDDGFWK